MDKHILAIGGGGYSGPVGGPSKIIRYFLDLTGKKFPKVCFLPTAAGDSAESINKFVHAMNSMGAHPNFLRLYHLPTKDIESFVMDFDAVYVSGGHTRNMLALWKEWGLDNILEKAWNEGVILGGGSAGGICWFDSGCSDSITNEFDALPGLGWLKGSFGPHYLHKRGLWRTSYMEMVAKGELPDGYAVSDRAALHYIGTDLTNIVSEWEEAAVFKIEKDGDAAVELPLDLEML